MGTPAFIYNSHHFKTVELTHLIYELEIKYFENKECQNYEMGGQKKL